MHDPASQQLAHHIIARKLLWLLPALLLAMMVLVLIALR